MLSQLGRDPNHRVGRGVRLRGALGRGAGRPVHRGEGVKGIGQGVSGRAMNQPDYGAFGVAGVVFDW
ncbi:MAG: hypothetical protein JJT96_04735 [Opitutales bacterium]|nr:hypothetical protein [Opitutales bacterium]